MSSPEQDEWKSRWELKGLPSTLLDEMIAEANTEYETELGVWKYNNYATVRMIVDNDTCAENEAFIYIIQRADCIFMGKGIMDTSFIFPQVPCTEIVFQVYKIRVTESIQVMKYGYNIQTVVKDMDVHISVSDAGEPLVSPSLTVGNIALTWVAKEIPPLSVFLDPSVYIADNLLVNLSITLISLVVVT